VEASWEMERWDEFISILGCCCGGEEYGEDGIVGYDVDCNEEVEADVIDGLFGEDVGPAQVVWFFQGSLCVNVGGVL